MALSFFFHFLYILHAFLLRVRMKPEVDIRFHRQRTSLVWLFPVPGSVRNLVKIGEELRTLSGMDTHLHSQRNSLTMCIIHYHFLTVTCMVIDNIM
jgi:hypothetical protein